MLEYTISCSKNSRSLVFFRNTSIFYLSKVLKLVLSLQKNLILLLARVSLFFVSNNRVKLRNSFRSIGKLRLVSSYYSIGCLARTLLSASFIVCKSASSCVLV